MARLRAEQARRALTTSGYPLAMITADGAWGYLPHAPYERIIFKVAVHQVPYPWVAQTRPGGKILTPWGTSYHNGALVSGRLSRVVPDGAPRPGPQRWRITVTPEGHQVTLTESSAIHPAEKHADEA